ncbi:hypothetical protein [Rickettsiales endosymbiont of Peranema trichophorum]|uniref:hypothetical protein n=1 Tax=Rickettsiales endosymbiont of Peranema trichophorum TaxID=2486577 RepID=UPI0013EE8762|nr:hypothetical protein [Rickettsiales endosymbiont of Peranema trichophorum]
MVNTNQQNIQAIKIGSISKIGEHKKNNTKEYVAFRAALEREFEHTKDLEHKYVLNITYQVYKEPTAIQLDTTITRVNLRVTVMYELIDLENRQNVLKDKLISTEGLDLATSPYSNYVSEEEIAIRIMETLAHTLKLKLIASIKQ